MAKLFASEKAAEICDKAARIYASYGYAMEYPIQRYLPGLVNHTNGTFTQDLNEFVSRYIDAHAIVFFAHAPLGMQTGINLFPGHESFGQNQVAEFSNRKPEPFPFLLQLQAISQGLLCQESVFQCNPAEQQVIAGL